MNISESTLHQTGHLLTLRQDCSRTRSIDTTNISSRCFHGSSNSLALSRTRSMNNFHKRFLSTRNHRTLFCISTIRTIFTILKIRSFCSSTALSLILILFVGVEHCIHCSIFCIFIIEFTCLDCSYCIFKCSSTLTIKWCILYRRFCLHDRTFVVSNCRRNILKQFFIRISEFFCSRSIRIDICHSSIFDTLCYILQIFCNRIQLSHVNIPPLYQII